MRFFVRPFQFDTQFNLIRKFFLKFTWKRQLFIKNFQQVNVWSSISIWLKYLTYFRTFYRKWTLKLFYLHSRIPPKHCENCSETALDESIVKFIFSSNLTQGCFKMPPTLYRSFLEQLFRVIFEQFRRYFIK